VDITVLQINYRLALRCQRRIQSFNWAGPAADWVGPGARNEQGQIIALDLKAGDRILFGKWSGTEVKLDGEELLIMKESDIMGVIEGQPATTTPAGKRKPAGLR
jgi:hypothetical protein